MAAASKGTPRRSKRRMVLALAGVALVGLGLLVPALLIATDLSEDEPQRVKRVDEPRGRPALQSPPAPERALSRPPGVRVLSNERTLSRWAHVKAATVARRGPDAGAAAVGRLSTQTSDRTPEVVLALSETTAPVSSRWVRVRLPMRPNGRTGWVPRRALGPYYPVTTFLRIDLRRLRAILRDRGRVVWEASIGVGRRSSPTPTGRFYIRSRILPRNTRGPYGVFAFGTSAYSPGLSDWPGGGVVGLHGTNRPGLIPGAISHGCVRIRNREIARLRWLMPLGTPIEVV